MDEFLARAILGGIGLALVAGPMGCFVVWRRMAYFGDTLSHTALLGVVLGVALGIHAGIGITLVCLISALSIARLKSDGRIASDTVLGILSHGSLAVGLVALSLLGDVRINLMGWLLGDILALNWLDVALIWGGGAALLLMLATQWRALVASCVDDNLAQVEGHQVGLARIILMVLIALVVAFAMKVVGVLLVTALLVIPAAAARYLARSPEQMALFASLLGALGVIAGVGASFEYDTPTGPSIVVAALVLFGGAALISRRG